MELLVRKSDKVIVVVKPDGAVWSDQERESDTFRVMKMSDAEFAKTVAVGKAGLTDKQSTPDLEDITAALTSGDPHPCFAYPFMRTTDNSADQKPDEVEKYSVRTKKLTGELAASDTEKIAAT